MTIACADHHHITEASITSKDPNIVDEVKRLVEETLTCRLYQPPQRLLRPYEQYPNNEQDLYSWRPTQNIYQDNYSEDPRRLLFDKSYLTELGTKTIPPQEKTLLLYYRLQLANQMHYCCFTCWKYNKLNDFRCRFYFVWKFNQENLTKCHVINILDRKKRWRVKVLPPRNNGHLNVCPVDPLTFLATQGNCDGQYICNLSAAVEYVMSYIGKSDEPDCKAIINLFARSLARVLITPEQPITNQIRLRNLANAIIDSQQVGTIHCCTAMMKIPFVLTSRTVVVINVRPRETLHQGVITDLDVLEYMDPQQNVLCSGPKSNIGQRNAYAALCEDQWQHYEQCNVTFFGMLTYFTIGSIDDNDDRTPTPHLITVTELGNINTYIILYLYIKI